MKQITLTRNTVVDGVARETGWEGEASDKAARYLIAIGKAIPTLPPESESDISDPDATPDESEKEVGDELIETTLPPESEKMIPGGRRGRKA